MHTTSGTDGKARVGDAFPTLELAATSGQQASGNQSAGTAVSICGRPLNGSHSRLINRRDGG